MLGGYLFHEAICGMITRHLWADEVLQLLETEHKDVVGDHPTITIHRSLNCQSSEQAHQAQARTTVDG